jgi:hypothetical protein
MAREESPIACQMNALTIEERSRRKELFAALAVAVERVQELPGGIAVELLSDPNTWMTAAEFILLERRCCPFLSFSMELEREHGPLWLRITGREGVKEFLAAELQF